MDSNFVRIEVIDNDSLFEACDILHDAYFNLSAMEYDQSSATWKGIFEREHFENQKLIKFEKKFLFFTKVSFPLVRSELFLDGIKKYRIEDKSRIEIYTFSECQFKDNAYKFFFNEDMVITITFEDKPKGRLVDQELLDKKGSFYLLRNPFKRVESANR